MPDTLILIGVMVLMVLGAIGWVKWSLRNLERKLASKAVSSKKQLQTKSGQVYNYAYTDRDGQNYYRHQYGGDAVSILVLWWVLTPAMQAAYASEHPTFEADAAYQADSEVLDVVPAGAVVPVTEEPISVGAATSDDDSSRSGGAGGCSGGGSSCGSSCGGGGGCGGGCGG